MIKLQDSQIAQILPECFAKKAEVRAVSFAIHKAVERLIGYCGAIGVFASIDTATGNVLDLLAIELGTQYYDDSLPIQTKRKLIKNTLVWHMNAGTPQAVEELVASVFGSGKVEEWFEYGGDPYYFKVITDTAMTPEMVDYFFGMICKVKNVRSHIQSIEIHHSREQAVRFGAFPSQTYKPMPVKDSFAVSHVKGGQEDATTI